MTFWYVIQCIKSKLDSLGVLPPSLSGYEPKSKTYYCISMIRDVTWAGWASFSGQSVNRSNVHSDFTVKHI